MKRIIVIATAIGALALAGSAAAALRAADRSCQPITAGLRLTDERSTIRMPHYLLQVAYEPSAIADLISNPQDRGEAIRPVVEKLGGRVAGLGFVIELDFLNGRSKLGSYAIQSLIHY